MLKIKKARPDTTTEKGAPAFSTTKCARLDLFFGGLVRGAAEDKVTQLFAAAWKENPAHAVQLMLHSRDCRGGKGEKAVSLMCLQWLRKHKPATYLLNLENFLSTGYWKDMLTISLAVYQQGLPLLSAREEGKECFELELFAEHLRRDHEALQKLQALRLAKAEADEKADAKGEKGSKTKDKAAAAEAESEGDEEWEKVGMDTTADKESKEGKEEKKGEADGKKATKPKAKRIEISLAAKWAPGEKTSFDKKGNLAKRLAKLLFPNDKAPMKAYRALIGPLRAELKVVERFMCGGEWESINFSHVPSRAHKLLKKAFAKHQPERYSQYLAALKSGKDPKVKINTATLHPHELVAPYLSHGGLDETTEAQWTDMLAKLKAKGCFDSALAVCDVSGSMSGEPLQVAVSLGLVISEMTKAPFGGRIITFSSTPAWHIVQGQTLQEKVQCVARAHWEQSTNLIGVCC